MGFAPPAAKVFFIALGAPSKEVGREAVLPPPIATGAPIPAVGAAPGTTILEAIPGASADGGGVSLELHPTRLNAPNTVSVSAKFANFMDFLSLLVAPRLLFPIN